MDQEPKNLFEIDDKTGVIRSKQPLDREKYNSFTVRLKNELQKSELCFQAQSAEAGCVNEHCLMHRTGHVRPHFFKAPVYVSVFRQEQQGLSSSQKQPEVNFQGDFMGILGDILKCSKPDDCDVTHSAEANILHTSLCRCQHILCSDTSSAHSHLG